jgi:uncharacterized protein YkwD
MKSIRSAAALAACLVLASCLSLFEEGSSEPAAGPEAGPGSAPAARPAGRYWWSMEGWDLAALDTARTVDYLTPAEKDLVLALNMVRRNPSAFAREIVEPMLAMYQGNILRMPGDGVGVITQEGAVPVRELTTFLRTAVPMRLLTPSVGLSRTARDLAVDQAASGAVGHQGSDGSMPEDRAHRHGAWILGVAETVDYGQDDGFLSAIDLLVDDGVPSRGHRKIIMEPDLETAGVAVGPHPRYRAMAVVDYAGHFFDADEHGRVGMRVQFNAWKGSAFDTGRDSRLLTPIEKDIVLGINLLRGDPRAFVAKVLDPLIASAVDAAGLMRKPDGKEEPFTYLSAMVFGGSSIFLGQREDIPRARSQFLAAKPAGVLRVAPELMEAASREVAKHRSGSWTGEGMRYIMDSRLPFDALTYTIFQASQRVDQWATATDDVTRALLVANMISSGSSTFTDARLDSIGIARTTPAQGETDDQVVVYLARRKK